MAIVSELITVISADTSGAERGIDTVDRKINNLAGIGTVALGNLGAAAIQAGLAFAGDFARDSVKAAGDFEANLLRMQSIAGTSLADAGFAMDDLRNKALEMGSSTAFSASEALDAMIALQKGGIGVADVMGGAADATLALAAAGELDLANAADIVSRQLGVWASTGVEAANVADLLAQAANASTVDVDELAMGLANVGGTAKASGVEFDDLVQTMALIAPGFQSASDAGTSLKTFISSLIPKSNEAKDAMVALGLATEDGKSKFFDAEGAFIGMSDASELLQNAMSGLSEEQKLNALNTIFGADAIRAATAIAESGAEGFASMGGAMAAAGGAAAQATERNQGFNFALESLSGSIETVQILLGELFLPTLTSLAGKVTGVVNDFGGFIQAFTATEDKAGFLSTALGDLGPPIMEAARAFGEMLAPHMERLGGIMNDKIMPILRDVGGFLADNLPRAIEVLTPLVVGLVDTGLSIMSLTLTAIAETWSQYLAPAFESMGKWLEDVTGGWDNLARGAGVARDILGEIAQAISDIAAGKIDFGQIGRGFENLLAGDFSGFGIPGFAGGVTNFSGGLALVGERGPELVNLPGGSDVIPNNMIGGMGGQTIIVQNYISGNVVAERDLQESTRLYLEEWNRRNG